MIETIEDAAGFEKLRDEWDTLLETSASNCLFLTWEWLYPWWKHLSGDRTLRIVTLRSGGELVAIAPLASRPRRLARLVPFRSLEFIGADRVCSDYLDLIIKRGREPEALDALAKYLSREKLMIEMANVRRTSLATQLTAELERHGWSRSEETIAVCRGNEEASGVGGRIQLVDCMRRAVCINNTISSWGCNSVRCRSNSIPSFLAFENALHCSRRVTCVGGQTITVRRCLGASQMTRINPLSTLSSLPVA